MSKIKELPKSSSHLLQCTQIITSVQSVVKELIENAIDSCSKNIEIKLDDYGLDKIEVKDNGSGICKEDIDKVCKPHCTSKITSHADLNQIQTYGFRGEALAAICAVSDLTITTKTTEEQFGFTYVFGKNGEVVSTKPYPCTQGTTVSATNLFKNIPVRKQYYRTDKNKKEELKKIEDILCAFGCIHTDIRFALFHNKSIIWQKPVVNKIREGLVSIFGCSVVDHMQNCEYLDDKEQVKIEVFLPKGDAPAFCSNTTANRSIISINKRPVRMKVIDKVLKQCFNKSLTNLSKSRYPTCFISIEVPPSETDVNVEPNKTTVVLHNMDVVTEQLTAILKTFYDNDSSNENIDKSKQLEAITKAKVLSLESPIKRSEISVVSSPAVNLSQSMKFPSDKNKCFEKKKLSKSSDLHEPAVKKLKTSSSSGKDIYHHIKTMDSFFSAANSSDLRNTDSNSTLFLSDSDALKNSFANSDFPTKSPVSCASANIQSETTTALQSTISTDMNLLDNPLGEIQLLNTEQHCAAVTAKRKQLNLFTTDKEIVNPNHNNVADLDLNKNRDPEDANSFHINDGNPIGLFNLDETSSKHFSSIDVNTPIEINDNFILRVNEDLNFQTAKAILENNNNNLAQDNQEYCGNNISNNSCSPASKPTNESENHNSSNLTESQNWSRGKHTIEDLQPVAVLRPQNIEKCSKNDKEEIFKEKASSKELNISITNQRKMTAFDFFCRNHRLEIASLNPEMSNHQIAQILSEKWNNLSSDEKCIYKNMIDKDYPKLVKSKEKLGNSVILNINKTKRASAKKARTRKKCRERIISFDFKAIPNSNPRHSSEEMNIINCIAPGIWIYSDDKKLYILNTFRLQEMIIYHRLLNTFRFEPEQLEFPCIVSNDTLGEEAVAFISQLPRKEGYFSETIMDERIVANGFEIHLLKGQGEIQIQVVGMTKSIAFYSVVDLKEILLLLKEKGPSATLSECRPGKIILYLQSEAVRMARQFPASKSTDDVRDLLKSKGTLPLNCDSCIHSKPFIREIATLS